VDVAAGQLVGEYPQAPGAVERGELAVQALVSGAHPRIADQRASGRRERHQQVDVRVLGNLGHGPEPYGNGRRRVANAAPFPTRFPTPKPGPGRACRPVPTRPLGTDRFPTAGHHCDAVTTVVTAGLYRSGSASARTLSSR